MEGVWKALFFEGKYDTKMEFTERWLGWKLKTLSWDRLDTLWNNILKNKNL